MASGSVLAILTSLASRMMALTGIVFSVMLLGIQFGASSYMPRLINEMSRRLLRRHPLGVFAGTFMYSVVAIHAVDQAGGAGVAQIAVCGSPSSGCWPGRRRGRRGLGPD